MRTLRTVAVLLAIAGGLLGSTPVEASPAQWAPITLTLAQRWSAGQQGAWSPYVATVRNDSGIDFTGDVTLQPTDPPRGRPAQAAPDHRARVVVPHGAERSVTFYVVDTDGGYRAALSDASGHRVAVAGLASAWMNSPRTVAVLSDQPQAAGRIEVLRPLPASFSGGSAALRTSRFASAQDFPANAVYLSGVAAVVIDDFDVSTLSDAQVRALRDFVGLGGSLVATGGASWRRTLLPLSQKGLAALVPTRGGEASLQPLAELVGRATALTAPAALGDLVAGRVLVGSPNGVPLVVEAPYGAGRVIELAYDPLAEPVAGDGSGLDQLSWSVALSRALLETTAWGSNGVAVSGVAQSAIGAPAGGTADEVVGILKNTPAAAVPPLGLLAALLLVYVMLAGPLSYLVLRGFGRRELMWVSVPLIALMFTGAAYVTGAAVHGSAYFDNEVDILRLGPDGVAQVHAYHGLYPPHRGNFTVDIAPNTLASTAVGTTAGLSPVETAVVTQGSRTRVELRGTAYGSFRSLQTLALARAPLQPQVSLESHLKLSRGRVVGTVRNTGERPVRQLSLVSGTGQQARIADDLPPRATVTVDSPLSTAGPATASPNGGQYRAATDYKRDLVQRVAAGSAVTGRDGEWALVGVTEPLGPITVDGATPARSGVSALIDPVAVEASDSLAHAPRPSLVATTSTVPYHYEVLDLVVPAGYSGPVLLSSDVTALDKMLPVRSVEIYDWTTGGWRQLVLSVSNQRSVVVPVAPSEVAGAVRLRVSEQSSQSITSFKLVGTIP